MSIFCFTTGLTNVSSMLGIESRDRTISDNYSLLSLIIMWDRYTHIHLQQTLLQKPIYCREKVSQDHYVWEIFTSAYISLLI